MRITLGVEAPMHANLLKTGGSRACEGPPLPLTPLHQLTPICHLLHNLLLHKEEVHALHLALLRLLACMPDANAPQFGLCVLLR